jgi:hypothetical protein
MYTGSKLINTKRGEGFLCFTCGCVCVCVCVSSVKCYPNGCPLFLCTQLYLPLCLFASLPLCPFLCICISTLFVSQPDDVPAQFLPFAPSKTGPKGVRNDYARVCFFFSLRSFPLSFCI